MRVGLSTTLLETSLGHARLDGIGTYTRELLTELRRLREPVTVVPVAYTRLRRWMPTRSDFPDGRFFALPYPVSSVLSDATGLPFPGEGSLRGAIDLFHSTDYLVPRLSRTPVIATFCDAIQLKHPEWCVENLSSMRVRLLKSAAKRAQHVIAISRAAVADLVEWFDVSPEIISVVPLGVGSEWFDRADEERLAAVRRTYGLPSRYILTVGTLQPRKNVETLLDAFLHLPRDVRGEVKLVVVGKTGWKVERLVERLRGLGEAGDAMWLNYVPLHDLRAIYQAADVFAFPSLYEGFGLPVLEAFASQTPVVASNLTSIPEVAGDSAVLIDPDDVEQFSASLLKVMEDSSLAKALRGKGLLRAREFTWSRCAEETYRVYSALAG